MATHVEELRAYRKANAERRKENNRRWLAEHPGIVAKRVAERRAAEIQAMPAWSNRTAMAAFYVEAQNRSKATGVKWHVDHVIPLRGKFVCGLHVESNLQLLTESQNAQKSNRFVIT